MRRFLRYIRVCVVICALLPALPSYPAVAAPSEKVTVSPDDDGLEYVDMKPILVPVINRDGRTQNMSILISLGIDQGRKPFLERYQPRLANAYIQTLYGMFDSGEAVRPGGYVDAEKVQMRLMRVTEDMLHDNERVKVHTLLLKVMQGHASN